jgi:hypothetical protein
MLCARWPLALLTVAFGQCLAANAEVYSSSVAVDGEFAEIAPVYESGSQDLTDLQQQDVDQASLLAEEPGIAETCQQCCPTICRECCQCCPCCPKWTIRAGAVFLDRNRPSSSTILTANFDPNSAVVLNGNQFDPSVGWGYEVSAIRHRIRNTSFDVEARYFGVYGFSSTVGPFAAAPGLATQFVIPGGFLDPTVSTATFTSQLQNVEFNLRHHCGPSIQLLGGFRWVELDDNLSIFSVATNGAGSATQNIITNNRLFGGQVGIDAFLWQRGRLSLDGIGKAGIYGNAVNNNLLITQPGGPTFNGGASQGQTAFVGEMGLTGRYRVTSALSLRATYQLLWLDGVAIATDQIRTLSINGVGGPPSGVNYNTVFYNGMFVGMESQF